MAFRPTLVLCVAPAISLLLGGCERDGKPETTSAPASTSTKVPAVPSAAEPEPSAAPPASSSAGLAAPAIDDWMVGAWEGHASVYAEVVDDHQTYTRWEVSMKIDPTGTVDLAMKRGNTPGGVRLSNVSYQCAAKGMLEKDGKHFVLRTGASSCHAAPEGSVAVIEPVRVGRCLVQWNTQEGKVPYAVSQIAFRRKGCRQ